MKYSHLRIQKIAEQFWSHSLLPKVFPISLHILEQAILITHPISIVKLNRVSLGEISKYLQKRGIIINGDVDNKELYGFILSQGCHTFIFINGLEPEAEQCFTLAHELAHYILDFWFPRQKLISVYGASICEPLDGNRPFTADERILALIKGHTLSSYLHLLDEPATSTLKRFDIWNSEASADQLALELIAPYASILADIQINFIHYTFNTLMDFLPSHLMHKYNLANEIADSYSKYIAQKLTGGISLKEKWMI